MAQNKSAIITCSICDLKEDQKNCFTRCDACKTSYCDKCAEFNDDQWKTTENVKKNVGGGWSLTTPVYSKCISCYDAAKALKCKNMLKNRIAILPHRCFQCRSGATYYTHLSHCRGCQREWCDDCKDTCGGIGGQMFTIDYGCDIDVDYRVYNSCAMCNDVGAAPAIIVANVVEIIKKTNPAELCELAGVDYEVLADKAKRRIIDDAAARKK